MFEPLRFFWNATRGHRLFPWRSPYLRWRMETYSGIAAEKLTASQMWSLLWRDRRQFLRFLRWTRQLARESNRG